MPKKKLFSFILTGLFLASVSFAKADVRNVSFETIDSVSKSIAAIWAENIASIIPEGSSSDTLFVRGLLDGVDVNPDTDAYYRGLLAGIDFKARMESMKNIGLPIDISLTANEIGELIVGKKSPIMDNEGANTYLNNYLASLYQPVVTNFSKEKEEAFIDSVAQAEGVERQPSGILLIIIEDSEGPSPSIGDNVWVSYRGSLSNGEIFDETEEPIQMTVGTLVPGFNSALLQMHEGGKYRVLIPSDLAYGEQGIPGDIPGNATLDFLITLEKN